MAAAAASRTLRVILVGNGSAGKTSLCTRFREDGFARVYKQTVGIEFLEKTVKLGGGAVSLQVWDIGGQSIGSKMLGQYVSGADVTFLCYDITDAQSFADAEDWLALTRRGGAAAEAAADGAAPAQCGGAIYLVGNKVDLEQLRVITPGMHARFIESHALAGGFLISARSGDGVQTAFFQAAAAALGVALSEVELELTRKVLSVTVSAEGGADAARSADADEIERQDREAEAARLRREASSCCTVA